MCVCDREQSSAEHDALQLPEPQPDGSVWPAAVLHDDGRGRDHLLRGEDVKMRSEDGDDECGPNDAAGLLVERGRSWVNN